MEVYDLKTKQMVQEPEAGRGAIRFTYGTAFGRFLAKTILCRKWVSNVYAAWQKSSLSRGKVKKFMKQYGITIDDCVEDSYPNFNAFFTRQRKPQKDETPKNALDAVADSKLLSLPIEENSRFEIKGVPYTLEELLESRKLAEKFAGGLCLIFRLAPTDYHRYAYPDSGTQEDTVKIPGVLHTVNPIAGTMKVYRRNTRQYQVLHTEHFGDLLQMEVGAMLVGKIINHNEGPGTFEKLQEKGYFEYGGSTVILLCEKDRVRISSDIWEHSQKGIETRVTLGDQIGEAL